MPLAIQMPDSTPTSSTYRWVSAAFGAFLIVIAGLIVSVSELSLGPLAAAAVIGLLGVDAVVSAYRKTRSLISRIGPLP